MGGRSRRRLALDALADRYGTRARPDGTRAALEWLDAHWAAATPDDALVFHNSDDGKSVDRLAVALHDRGAPCLFMLAEAPHVHRFDLFVAAWAPARAERAGDPTAAELRAAGLRVTLGPPGIHAWAPTSAPAFCEAGAALWLLDRATHLRV
ncbi:MAG: hypothetical protein WKG00_33635 [Polyangiaceae bacterium]